MSPDCAPRSASGRFFAKKRGLNRRSGPPVHDDLVDRQFTARAADELWLTDITEHRTDEGKLYLCAIKDVWSNRIVGYTIDSRMKSSLAVAALDHAVVLRSPAETVVHSDRGSQFRTRKFVHALLHNGLHGSMGRVGACGDNAAMIGAQGYYEFKNGLSADTSLNASAV